MRYLSCALVVLGFISAILVSQVNDLGVISTICWVAGLVVSLGAFYRQLGETVEHERQIDIYSQ